jgi:hypothetical protein
VAVAFKALVEVAALTTFSISFSKEAAVSSSSTSDSNNNGNNNNNRSPKK